MDAAKEEFLKEFGRDYGYPGGPKTIDEIRATEFKRLGGKISIQFWESDRSGPCCLSCRYLLISAILFALFNN